MSPAVNNAQKYAHVFHALRVILGVLEVGKWFGESLSVKTGGWSISVWSILGVDLGTRGCGSKGGILGLSTLQFALDIYFGGFLHHDSRGHCLVGFVHW